MSDLITKTSCAKCFRPSDNYRTKLDEIFSSAARLENQLVQDEQNNRDCGHRCTGGRVFTDTESDDFSEAPATESDNRLGGRKQFIIIIVRDRYGKCEVKGEPERATHAMIGEYGHKNGW